MPVVPILRSMILKRRRKEIKDAEKEIKVEQARFAHIVSWKRLIWSLRMVLLRSMLGSNCNETDKRDNFSGFFRKKLFFRKIYRARKVRKGGTQQTINSKLRKNRLFIASFSMNYARKPDSKIRDGEKNVKENLDSIFVRESSRISSWGPRN